MLSVTGLTHFYYLRGFTDMRCKHSRVLSVIREQLHREPSDGEVFIVMSKNRRIVRFFAYDNRSYTLFEKKFILGYNRCEDMSDEMKNRYIEYLIERLENADLDNRAMKLVLEDLTLESSQSDKKLSEILDKLNDLESMLAEERKSRKLLERENQQLKERLKSSRKERFGSKKQSVKEDDSEEGHGTPADRQDEKDSFDGTDESLSTRSVPDPDAPVSETSRQPPLRDLSNCTGVYSHVRAKFVKTRMEGGEKNADVFLDHINRLFQFERDYDKEIITVDERTKRRQGSETMEVMINLRANLLQELRGEDELKSCYMLEALNYLHKFWKESFAYIKDERYPISNNLAERAVRPFTTKRKNSLHFGSDAGAEMAATYHSVISTVKLQSRSAWDYLGKFFTGIFNGCRDYLSLSPQNIDLAECQQLKSKEFNNKFLQGTIGGILQKA